MLGPALISGRNWFLCLVHGLALPWESLASMPYLLLLSLGLWGLSLADCLLIWTLQDPWTSHSYAALSYCECCSFSLPSTCRGAPLFLLVITVEVSCSVSWAMSRCSMSPARFCPVLCNSKSSKVYGSSDPQRNAIDRMLNLSGQIRCILTKLRASSF